MHLNADMKGFLTQAEIFGRLIKKIFITLVLLIFGGIIGCGFLFVKLQEWQADKVCQRQFGEEWSAVTTQGDVYGAFCIGPNRQNRFSRPRY